MLRVDSFVFILAWGIPTLGSLLTERTVYLQFMYLSIYLPMTGNGEQGGNKLI